MRQSRLLVSSLMLAFVLTACASGDTTPPVITVDPNFQSQQQGGGMIMMPTATCVDDVDATCFVQTTLPTNWPQQDLVPGTYTFTFTAQDHAGNVATETADLIIS